MSDLLQIVFPTQWHVLVIAGVLLLVSAELGFRWGRRLFIDRDEARKSQIGAVQGAVLGLLGLLLGFTFSMAVQRYETRRALVVGEANAIGTALLRTDFLPAAQVREASGLLARYVEARLAFHAAGRSAEAVARAEQETADLQRQLWRVAVEAGRESPTPLTAMFVSALNDVIDLDAERFAAMRNRVPGVVWLLLLGVASCGCLTSGYAAGATGKRAVFPMVILPVMLSAVMLILVDMSLERRGMIGVDQEPLRRLQASLAPAPAVP